LLPFSDFEPRFPFRDFFLVLPLASWRLVMLSTYSRKKWSR
jgi:hypothetical protein